MLLSYQRGSPARALLTATPLLFSLLFLFLSSWLHCTLILLLFFKKINRLPGQSAICVLYLQVRCCIHFTHRLLVSWQCCTAEWCDRKNSCGVCVKSTVMRLRMWPLLENTSHLCIQYNLKLCIFLHEMAREYCILLYSNLSTAVCERETPPTSTES